MTSAGSVSKEGQIISKEKVMKDRICSKRTALGQCYKKLVSDGEWVRVMYGDRDRHLGICNWTSASPSHIKPSNGDPSIRKYQAIIAGPRPRTRLVGRQAALISWGAQ